MNPKPIVVTYVDPQGYSGPAPQPFAIVGEEPGGGGGGAVASVNGKTGAVVLAAGDVGALPDSYEPDLSGYVEDSDPRLPIVLTQAAYDGITPVAGQVYIIQG